MRKIGLKGFMDSVEVLITNIADDYADEYYAPLEPEVERRDDSIVARIPQFAYLSGGNEDDHLDSYDSEDIPSEGELVAVVIAFNLMEGGFDDEVEGGYALSLYYTDNYRDQLDGVAYKDVHMNIRSQKDISKVLKRIEKEASKFFLI